MRPLVQKLVVAALVAASLPAAARAADCDHDRDGTAVVYHRPQPYPPPAPGWQADRRPWRESSWRQREVARVRTEIRDLDAQRAEFHARFAGRPGKLRKFDRWYSFRRAELERRYWELQRFAWR